MKNLLQLFRPVLVALPLIAATVTLPAQAQKTSPAVQPQQMKREANDEVARREQYYHDRRAGGPGKKIGKTVYDQSIQQMLGMDKARRRFTTDATLPSWSDVSKGGESYGGTYGSGRAVQIAFDPTSDSIMYLASAGGGVWKTTDDGTSWSPLTDHLTTSACGAIAVDPNHPQTIFYASGEENFSLDSYYGEGIFRSTDGGTNWTRVAGTGAGTYYAQIVIDPHNSNIIYAANDLGIIKSTNGGTVWNLLTSGAGNRGDAECVILNPQNSNTIYATFGGYNGNVAEKSTNAGATWTVMSGYLGTSTGRTQLAIAPSDTNYLYGASVITGGNGGIWFSTDAGNSWFPRDNTDNYMGTQDWYDNVITVNPSNNMDVVVGGLQVYESTDAGQTLSQISAYATPPHPDIHGLTYHGNYLYTCSDGGLYRTSNDGSTWIPLNRNISTLEYQGADYAAGNPSYLIGGMQDNGKSKTTNGGTIVALTLGGDGGYVELDPGNSNITYGSFYDNSLHRSNNAGVSWSNIYPTAGNGGLFYPPFHLAPGNSSDIVYGLSDVWENSSASTTGQSGWTKIFVASGTTNCTAIGISATNTNRIYLGFDDGHLRVTTNNGTNWSATSFPDYIGDIAVDPTNDSVGYATLTGFDGLHVYKTMNLGGSWTNITNNLPNTPTNSIVIRTAPPRMLIVGTDIGVFNSTDDGAHWASLNNGLPFVPVFDLKYRENDKILLAATHGRGLWEYNLGSFGFSASTSSLPFGTVAYGTAKVESVYVTNGSAVTLNISNVLASDSEFVVSPQSTAISSDSSRLFTVAFTPSSSGAKSATITFTDDGITSPDQISASGTGIASTFSDNKTSISFGNIRLGLNKSDSIKVTNTGNSMLHLTAASSDVQFQISPAIDSIAPAASHQFPVLFTPGSAGAKSASAIFTTDSPNNPDTVALTGGGGVATVELKIYRDSSSTLVPSKWGIALYQDSVTAGTLVASGTTSDFPVVVLSSGTYIVAEADSGNIVRENGNGTRYDTLQVANDTTVVDTFVNRYFSISVETQALWNLVSTPAVAKDSSYSGVFPSAFDELFGYDANGYEQFVFLRPGVGYWLKFPSAAASVVLGGQIDSVGLPVMSGWNLVGAPSVGVEASDISSTPAGIISSFLWGYSHGYFRADSVLPGHAYWINTSQAGVLHIPAQSNTPGIKPKAPVLDSLNQIIVTDAKGMKQTLYFSEPSDQLTDPRLFKMPPSAPKGAFEARFANGGFIAASPFTADPHGTLDISLTSAAYPVSIKWKLSTADRHAYALAASGASSAGTVALRGLTGSTTIRNAKVKIISIGLAASDLPKAFALAQNFPNPFNPSTVIKYELPVDSRVTIRVYNVLGEEIAELIGKTQTAGFQSVTWNGLNKSGEAVPSGMYFYRMEATSVSSPANSFTQVKKMMLLK